MPPADRIPDGCLARHVARVPRPSSGAAFMPPADRIPHGCLARLPFRADAGIGAECLNAEQQLLGGAGAGDEGAGHDVLPGDVHGDAARAGALERGDHRAAGE